MLWLSLAAKPLVRLLAVTTDALVRPLGRHKADEPPVTEEEIKGLMRQGASAGVFEAHESHIVSRVFNLDDHTVGHIMTPRADLVVIDTEADPAATLELLKQSDYTRYPVVRGDVSNVVGVIDSGDLLAHHLKSGKLMPERVRKDAVFIPETVSVLEALETFKRTRESLAFVVDEHGEVLGLITLTDVLEAIVGDLGDEDEAPDSDAVRRAGDDASLPLRERQHQRIRQSPAVVVARHLAVAGGQAHHAGVGGEPEIGVAPHDAPRLGEGEPGRARALQRAELPEGATDEGHSRVGSGGPLGDDPCAAGSRVHRGRDVARQAEPE